MQRESSIEDQMRRCREYATRQGWKIAEQFVTADKAVSAAAIAGRDGLQHLVKAAKDKNRPFDCLLVDDTSRLARDLSDTLRTFKILEFHGVAIVSVSQGIDSLQGNARTLLAMHGMMDEQYLTDLAAKVHRGQEGRALHGYTTGGRVYGYKNVPVEDATRTGKYGRPAVLGVELEIIPEQAAIVKRIFAMYSAGIGQATIAAQLNSEAIPGPNGPWSKYTIHEMLRNERYRGVNVWGRTKKSRNPETGKKVSRATAESQWRRVDVLKWRIVPEELWQSVQERCKKAKENFHRMGGLTRTERGRTYLFSGALVCGQCGGAMVICTGGGKRGYVKYGCHDHKHTGVCGNKLMIRQDRLESQLLSTIEQRILNPVTLDYAVSRCEREFRDRLAEIERQGRILNVDSLKRELEDRKRRWGNLLNAIEMGGDISTLTERRRELESEIKLLQESIAGYRPVNIDEAVGVVRATLTKALQGLHACLRPATNTDFARAKEAIAKHVGKLVLTPAVREGRPIYVVTGKMSVETDSSKCRMQLVARDGLEPPTPAFSGLRSTN
jgi:site-specific DNA recombinase